MLAVLMCPAVANERYRRTRTLAWASPSVSAETPSRHRLQAIPKPYLGAQSSQRSL